MTTWVAFSIILFVFTVVFGKRITPTAFWLVCLAGVFMLTGAHQAKCAEQDASARTAVQLQGVK